ncbi:hypothetical protein DEO72_LG11g922 [Vigna unguiculata]|uniref:Uncharacterized protein n=1 Tax=Vigna unguiculata TaxID=3917 RepID=A0A4D6NMM3_VIGUN|nr:hypothetical protein DEO72_LG11g922 [Vigna unguiculata]
MAATSVGRQRCEKCGSRRVRRAREDEAVKPPWRAPSSMGVAGESAASWRGEAERGRAVADWSRGGSKGKGEEAAGRRRSFIFLN